MRLKAAYTSADLIRMTGLSRWQIHRMKRRHGWGRVVYLTQLQALGELWDSLVLREQLDEEDRSYP